MTGSALLRKAITRNRGWLFWGSAMYGGHQVCEVAVPVVIGIIIDRPISTGDTAELVLWIAVLIALFVVLSLMWRFGARLLTYAEAGEGATLRIEAASKMLDPRGIRTDLKLGDLLTISSSDADNASYLLDYIPRIVASVTALVVSTVVLLTIHVPLGIAVLVATPVVVGILQLSAPLITRRIQHQQERMSRAASVATDLVSGLRPLRGIRAQTTAHARYREASRASLASTVAAARVQRGFEGVSATISNLLAAAVAIGAGWLALADSITVGDFVTVVGLAQFLIGPFTQLTVVPSWIAEARASANRVAGVFSSPPLYTRGGAELDAAPADLELDGVGHGRLEGLSLTVSPGEFVGVVAVRPAIGEALAEVLAGRVAAHDGIVRYGEQDLAQVDAVSRRSVLVADPHIPDVFTGTLGSNIDMGRPSDADPTDMGEVLSASAAVELVDAAADGLNTPVAERGASLSGGQRQRLALARALYTDVPVLVLHDPTTAVDAVTEHAVAQGIHDLRHRDRNDRSTLVITSSPALLAAADRVVVIGGDERIDGTHAELAAHNEFYRQAVLR